MTLSAPTRAVFLIALILGILGTVGTFITLPVIGGYSTYMLIGAFILLVVGNLFNGI